MVSKEQIDRLVDAIEGVSTEVADSNTDHNFDLLISWVVEINNTLERIAVALEKK